MYQMDIIHFSVVSIAEKQVWNWYTQHKSRAL